MTGPVPPLVLLWFSNAIADVAPRRRTRPHVRQDARLRWAGFGDYIQKASRSRNRQEGRAGMGEILFELRLIFHPPPAVAGSASG